MSSSKAVNSTKPTTTNSAEIANSSTPQPTATPTPVSKDPETILRNICAKYKASDNCVIEQENGGWAIVTISQTDEDFMLFTRAQMIARNFIFDVYATKLPIKQAAISIDDYAAREYYNAGLGADLAGTQPESTWTDNSVNPEIFYNFLKNNTTGSAGDGNDSTYVETNLK